MQGLVVRRQHTRDARFRSDHIPLGRLPIGILSAAVGLNRQSTTNTRILFSMPFTMRDGFVFFCKSFESLAAVFLPRCYPASVFVFADAGNAGSVVGRFLARTALPLPWAKLSIQFVTIVACTLQRLSFSTIRKTKVLGMFFSVTDNTYQ